MLLFMLCISYKTLFPADWYISNAGGMAIEPAFSRYALRSKYALSVELAQAFQLPERLMQYYDETYTIELRTLYEDGELSRQQWSFTDEEKRIRLVSVFVDDGSGFIELYTPLELILESHQIGGDGSDLYNLYTYNENFLLKAETWRFTPARVTLEAGTEGTEAGTSPTGLGEGAGTGGASAVAGEGGGADVVSIAAAADAEGAEEAPDEDAEAEEPIDESIDRTELLWTDYYRYNRSRSLRSVERRFSQGRVGALPPAFMRFPRLSLNVLGENEFVQPASAVSPEFFNDVILNSGDRILYTTDSLGRVTSEVRRDENDKILGEIVNTWSGDRLASVLWKAEDEERLIEYEYNADGDRILERNIRNGALERVVRLEDAREVEELYMNGEVVLRAVWEDGRKISEEWVRGDRQSPASGNGEE